MSYPNWSEIIPGPGRFTPYGTNEIVVTNDLVRLYKAQNWAFEDETEFGAAAVDPKRPYGNSDVLGDMRDLVGSGLHNDHHMFRLHVLMTVVNEIGCQTLQMSAGEYRRDERRRWYKVEDGQVAS